MNAAMYRNDPDRASLYSQYKSEAVLQNSLRDKKLAKLFVLQNKLMNKDHTVEPSYSDLRTLHSYWDDKDWFVASRAALMESSLQIFGQEFDVGLKDAQSALNLIPNKLGADYDEARYETYDFISYLQLILYNIEDGIGTTELVLEKGLESERQIDGISLINNMAYTFNNWREYETAEKLAEILFRINNKSSQGVNPLVYYRYAQAQNNAENFQGALTTIETALQSNEITTIEIGLVSERAIALAGLGRVREAERAFAKFDEIAKLNDIKTGGYSEVRLRARKLIALAKGDTFTANKIETERSKIIIQRLLRFQNKGISGLHASLENDKARQNERAAALEQEAKAARAEAAANKQKAYIMSVLALALFGLAIAGFNIARMRKKVLHTLEIAQIALEAGEAGEKNSFCPLCPMNFARLLTVS